MPELVRVKLPSAVVVTVLSKLAVVVSISMFPFTLTVLSKSTAEESTVSVDSGVTSPTAPVNVVVPPVPEFTERFWAPFALSYCVYLCIQ